MGRAKLELPTPAPSYKGLQPASEAASRVKRANRKTGTKPETFLRSSLWRLGLRFRKNLRSLPGTPDVVFPRAKVAVFVDGDFWHGRNWDALETKLARGTNAGYWPAKIRRNIERDRHTDAVLLAAGWCVIRLWETDVRRDVAAAARLVRDVVQTARAT